MNKQPDNRLSLHSEQGGTDESPGSASTLEGFAGLLAQNAAQHGLSDAPVEAQESDIQPADDSCEGHTA